MNKQNIIYFILLIFLIIISVWLYIIGKPTKTSYSETSIALQEQNSQSRIEFIKSHTSQDVQNILIPKEIFN